MSGPLLDAKLDLVKPELGQTVVVTVEKMPPPHVVEAMGDQLKRSFPDNRVVVMEEGTSLSVEGDRSDLEASLNYLLAAVRTWRREITDRDSEVKLTRTDEELLERLAVAEGNRR